VKIHCISVNTEKNSVLLAQRYHSAAEKFILEDLFSSVLSEFKKYHPSGNLKFNYVGILLKLEIAYFNGKILSISLKLNFTPNTLGSYGLSEFSLNLRLSLIQTWSDGLAA